MLGTFLMLMSGSQVLVNLYASAQNLDDHGRDFRRSITSVHFEAGMVYTVFPLPFQCQREQQFHTLHA